MLDQVPTGVLVAVVLTCAVLGALGVLLIGRERDRRRAGRVEWTDERKAALNDEQHRQAYRR